MLGWLLGEKAVDTVAAVAGGLNGLFTSDDERLTHGEVMARIKQQPDQAQNAVNAIEARHKNIFVAGWRPFIGWTCGVALAYQFVLFPLISWVVTLVMLEPVYPPIMETSELYTVLLGMLGMGTLRTFEKSKRVNKMNAIIQAGDTLGAVTKIGAAVAVGYVIYKAYSVSQDIKKNVDSLSGDIEAAKNSSVEVFTETLNPAHRKNFVNDSVVGETLQPVFFGIFDFFGVGK